MKDLELQVLELVLVLGDWQQLEVGWQQLAMQPIWLPTQLSCAESLYQLELKGTIVVVGLQSVLPNFG